MAEPIQVVAKTMEVGGASAAVTPWLMYVLGFLDQHTQAVMALCAIVGAATTVLGMLLHASATWYYKAREDRRQQHAHNMMFLKDREPR